MPNKKLKVLVTGGAGYVGTTLIPMLIEKGYQVTVFDRLLWNGDHVIPFLKKDNFRFIHGDVRDLHALKSACRGQDSIIHLAAIVGYPACDMNPKLADQTNVQGAINLSNAVSKPQHVIFASSLSNYGRVLDKICTEETPLDPITRYSRNKTEAEKILMHKTNCTAFRPGTAFGVSSRMRMDLLVHQLTKAAVEDKKITLYEADAVRPFIHVSDIARAFVFAVENRKKMAGHAFNLGADHMNYTKKEIAQMIAKLTGAKIIIDKNTKDPDERTYRVSFEKLRSLGYVPQVTMQEGILEIIKTLPILKTNYYPKPYSNANIFNI